MLMKKLINMIISRLKSFVFSVRIRTVHFIGSLYNDNNGKKRRHFVDIYIPNQNLCIEVKSTWTAKLHEGNILLKQSAGKELGFQYEIWVYSKEGIKVECHK